MNRVCRVLQKVRASRVAEMICADSNPLSPTNESLHAGFDIAVSVKRGKLHADPGLAVRNDWVTEGGCINTKAEHFLDHM